jgi:hypothetical protein
MAIQKAGPPDPSHRVSQSHLRQDATASEDQKLPHAGPNRPQKDTEEVTGQYASETLLSPAVEIAREFNPRSLSLEEVGLLADRLLETGLVSFEEHAHLRSHFARRQYVSEGTSSQSGVETVNLIHDLEQLIGRLRAEQASSPPPSLTSVLGLLQKIEYLHTAVQ